jgi:hypothetical protein
VVAPRRRTRQRHSMQHRVIVFLRLISVPLFSLTFERVCPSSSWVFGLKTSGVGVD